MSIYFTPQNIDEYQNFLKNSDCSKEIILCFSGSFCNPCKTIYPFIESYVNQHKYILNKYYFIKLDSELFPELFDNYNIKTIPAIFLKNKTFSIKNIESFLESL